MVRKQRQLLILLFSKVDKYLDIFDKELAKSIIKYANDYPDEIQGFQHHGYPLTSEEFWDLPLLAHNDYDLEKFTLEKLSELKKDCNNLQYYPNFMILMLKVLFINNLVYEDPVVLLGRGFWTVPQFLKKKEYHMKDSFIGMLRDAESLVEEYFQEICRTERNSTQKYWDPEIDYNFVDLFIFLCIFNWMLFIEPKFLKEEREFLESFYSEYFRISQKPSFDRFIKIKIRNKLRLNSRISHHTEAKSNYNCKYDSEEFIIGEIRKTRNKYYELIALTSPENVSHFNCFLNNYLPIETKEEASEIISKIFDLNKKNTLTDDEILKNYNERYGFLDIIVPGTSDKEKIQSYKMENRISEKNEFNKDFKDNSGVFTFYYNNPNLEQFLKNSDKIYEEDLKLLTITKLEDILELTNKKNFTVYFDKFSVLSVNYISKLLKLNEIYLTPSNTLDFSTDVGFISVKGYHTIEEIQKKHTVSIDVPYSIRVLEEKIKSNNESERRIAFYELATYDHEYAFKLVLDALENFPTRNMAHDSLRKMIMNFQEKLIKPITKILNDSSRKFRDIALNSLCNIKTEEVLDIALEYLNHKEENLRDGAIRLLGRLKKFKEKSCPVLTNLLEEKLQSEDETHVWFLVNSLSELKCENSIPLLLKCLQYEDEDIVAFVLNRLHYIFDFDYEELDNLLVQLSDDKRSAVLRTIIWKNLQISKINNT